MKTKKTKKIPRYCSYLKCYKRVRGEFCKQHYWAYIRKARSLSCTPYNKK